MQIAGIPASRPAASPKRLTRLEKRQLNGKPAAQRLQMSLDKSKEYTTDCAMYARPVPTIRITTTDMDRKEGIKLSYSYCSVRRPEILSSAQQQLNTLDDSAASRIPRELLQSCAHYINRLAILYILNVHTE